MQPQWVLSSNSFQSHHFDDFCALWPVGRLLRNMRL
jgi:hypothetical protein